MNPVVVYSAFGIACVTAIMALFLSRKLQNLTALYNDASSRLHAGKQAYQVLESQFKETVKSVEEYEDRIEKLDKVLHSNREKFAKEAGIHQKQIDAIERQMSQHVLRAEHLTEENEVLKNQLLEAQTEAKSQAAVVHAEAQKGLEEKCQKLEKKLVDAEDRLRDWHDRIKVESKDHKRLEARNKKLTDILRKVDPEEARKNKRKAKQMEQLYNSMRGLRELSVERIQNWEVALRKLSEHILGHNPGQEPAIGPLVGGALERIGETLVEESDLSESLDYGPDSKDAVMVPEELVLDQPPPVEAT